MNESPATAEPVAQADNPDHFFVGQLANRMPDGGPRYQETPADPYAAGADFIAEPYNTVTAALFVVIVAVWTVRVARAGWRTRPFTAACLPILLTGGVGGTLYHAFRTRKAYFLLDVIPISLLGLAGSIYLLVRLGKSAGWQRLAVYGFGSVAVYLVLNGVIFAGLLRGPLAGYRHMAVNLSYASLALIVVVPLGVVLARTRFRHGGLVVAALLSFGIAWFCRLADGLTSLPMGTHWLWHTFGAVTTALVFEYFFRLEREAV